MKELHLEQRGSVWVGTFRAMASPCEIHIELRSKKRSAQLIALAQKEALRIERLFSRYRDDNVIHRINTAAGKTVTVDGREVTRCVRYYELRWLIERYHYVLKSGCRIEESQLRSFDGLRRLLALFSAVALRLLWIMHSARTDGDQPCTVAFTDVEWQVLYRQRHSGPVPERPPPLRDVVLWTAKLGGFLGRKGDGEPGVKVLWRGLMRLQDIVTGFLLRPQDVGNA